MPFYRQCDLFFVFVFFVCVFKIHQSVGQLSNSNSPKKLLKNPGADGIFGLNRAAQNSRIPAVITTAPGQVFAAKKSDLWLLFWVAPVCVCHRLDYKKPSRVGVLILFHLPLTPSSPVFTTTHQFTTTHSAIDP